MAYVIGLALGDGNLSNPNGRATRLRITCDLKYPRLIERIIEAIQSLLPENKVSTVRRQGNCLDISCYSNCWESWLGWEVGMGPKYTQKVRVPDWIKNRKSYSIACLRGLIETDGSIYIDRGYPAVMFVTVIPELAEDVAWMILRLGFTSHTYRISMRKKLDRYNIRISKNVQEFVQLLDLKKD